MNLCRFCVIRASFHCIFDKCQAFLRKRVLSDLAILIYDSSDCGMALLLQYGQFCQDLLDGSFPGFRMLILAPNLTCVIIPNNPAPCHVIAHAQLLYLLRYKSHSEFRVAPCLGPTSILHKMVNEWTNGFRIWSRPCFD